MSAGKAKNASKEVIVDLLHPFGNGPEVFKLSVAPPAQQLRCPTQLTGWKAGEGRWKLTTT